MCGPLTAVDYDDYHGCRSARSGAHFSLTGLSGGEMTRIRSGMSSVRVVVAENMERRAGGIAALKLVEISSLPTRRKYA